MFDLIRIQENTKEDNKEQYGKLRSLTIPSTGKRVDQWGLSCSADDNIN